MSCLLFTIPFVFFLCWYFFPHLVTTIDTRWETTAAFFSFFFCSFVLPSSESWPCIGIGAAMILKGQFWLILFLSVRDCAASFLRCHDDTVCCLYNFFAHACV
ncbi:hypothetical protein V8C35DRAFT_263728 [Trichoderma chlorosporum]